MSAIIMKSKSSRRNGTITQWGLSTLLILGSVVMIIPFIWMLSTSFDWSARLEIGFPPRFWPAEPSTKNYHAAFTNVPMLRYIFNSLVVSAVVIAISVISALLSGYALSKIRFRGSKLVLVLALSTIMIPFEITMIPQFLLFSKLHLIDTYAALYLPALNYAFGTFLAKAFIDQLPLSLREAGIIDGAGEFRVFGKIYFPLCAPIVATLVILQFLHVWNDLLWPLLALKSASKFTIQLGLSMFSYNNGENRFPSIIMAATMVSLIPVIAVYLFLQRYIIESIAMTGVKQ